MQEVTTTRRSLRTSLIPATNRRRESFRPSFGTHGLLAPQDHQSEDQ